MARRHLFGWLSGLPGSILTDTDVNAPRIDQTRIVNLADPNRANLPGGAKWGIEIHDGSRSWFVAYRGCTGYDAKSPSGWCGAVQIVRAAASRIPEVVFPLCLLARASLAPLFSFFINTIRHPLLPCAVSHTVRTEK